MSDDRDLPADFLRARLRLRMFALSWNPGDEIDEDSRLTREDLDVLLAALDQAGAMVAVPRLNPKPVDKP